MSGKTRLRYAVSLILVASLIFLICSCAAIYHRYIMKGSIIEASDSEVYLCIGSKDGARVGQKLDVYRIIYSGFRGKPFEQVLTGKVKITEIIDEHFAKAIVISGEAKKDDIVELADPK